MKVDKLYIVSLDWDTESVNSILSEVNKVGLPHNVNYEVVGINGYALTTHHHKLMNITPYKDWNLKTGKVKVVDDENQFWHRDVTAGEVGCALSHVAIWEDAYENKYDNILVYEDDIVFRKQMDWSQLEKVKSMDYDLFYLGRLIQGGFDGVVDDVIDDMICKPGYSYQTHAYMLSKEGVRKLVENHLPLYKSMLFPVDELLPALYCETPRTELNDMFKKDMNTYALNENVVEQSRTEMYNNSLTQPTHLADDL